MGRVGVLVVVLAACTSSEPSPVTPNETIVSIVDEPAGDHCPNGGSAVQTGLDDNGNGVLDPAEVDKVDYVCNAAGTETLVRQTPVAAGAVCPGGGTNIESGRDLDHDGLLDDSEVEQTVTVCDTIEVWNGPLTTSAFTTPAQLEVLAKVRVINGNVVIDTSAEMPNLELLNGDLKVSGDEVELPALRTIVGAVTQDSYSTTRLVLPVVEHIGGELRLDTTAHDATISAPALSSVGGALTFIFLTGGDTIDLSGLKEVGGDLFLDSNLPDLSLTSLTTVAGSLRLEMDATNAKFPALKTVGGKLDVQALHLTDVTLPALESIAGDLSFLYSTPLTTLRFPALKTIGGSVSIDAKALATLDLTSLTDVGHDIVIDETLLTSLQLPNLRHIGVLDATNPDFNARRSLLLAKNKGLATINLASLATTEGWIIVSETDALTKLDLPALTTSYEVAVQYCPAFGELRAPALTEVAQLTLWDLPQLTVAEFPKLARVTTHTGIYRTGLQSLTGLSALTYTAFLELQDDEQLVDLQGLEKLTLVGHIHINSLGNLVRLTGLEHLTRASGVFELTMNTKLTDVSALSALRYIGMEFRLTNNTKLESLAGLEHLATIQGAFYLTHNNVLASLSGLAGLASVGGDLVVEYNPALPPAEVTALRTRLGK